MKKQNIYSLHSAAAVFQRPHNTPINSVVQATTSIQQSAVHHHFAVRMLTQTALEDLQVLLGTIMH
jgi:hypothetical protein